jgi:hypothetical protein
MYESLIRLKPKDEGPNPININPFILVLFLMYWADPESFKQELFENRKFYYSFALAVKK